MGSSTLLAARCLQVTFLPTRVMKTVIAFASYLNRHWSDVRYFMWVSGTTLRIKSKYFRLHSDQFHANLLSDKIKNRKKAFHERYIKSVLIFMYKTFNISQVITSVATRNSRMVTAKRVMSNYCILLHQ